MNDEPGAYRRSGILHKAESNRTAGYGTVRPVVWEDGGDGNIPASYPIRTPIRTPPVGEPVPGEVIGVKLRIRG